MVRDLIVVGAGIIGATVAEAFHRRGEDVLIIDDGRPMAGTPPSGGHMKVGWFGKMESSEYGPAMEMMDEIWGLVSEEFLWYKDEEIVTTNTIHRVNTDNVITYPKTTGTVIGIKHLDNVPLVSYMSVDDVHTERGHRLLVAVGAWAADLVEGLDLIQKQGVSFRLRGTVQPLVRPWAPYKQVVAHQQNSDEVWTGDGSTIIPANWTGKRTRECLGRCQEATGITTPPTRTIVGLRAYSKKAESEPCLFKKIGKRAWVATGAGKMGTIAAGWVARRMLDAANLE